MSKADALAAAAAEKVAAELALTTSVGTAAATFEAAFTTYIADLAAANALPDDPPPTIYYAVTISTAGFGSPPTIQVHQTNADGTPDGDAFTVTDGEVFQIREGRGAGIIAVGFSGSVNNFPITVDTTISLNGTGAPQFYYFTAVPT